MMTKTATLDEVLLTSEEAAKLLGWTENTLRRKRSQGEDSPDYVEVGRYRMYRPSDIAKWKAGKTRTPAGAAK